MKPLFPSLLLAACLIATAADAKTRFEPYEARNPVVEGQGGSRTTKDGVDFWTIGDPPRRYEIIGVIRDTRGTHGDAVGSGSIARKVRDVGGHAAILLHENSSLRGVWMQGQGLRAANRSFGTGLAIPIRRRTTVFAVVKYLGEANAVSP